MRGPASQPTARVVVIGGGTGIYAALLGLKRYPISLAAVVTMADDGGSSGRLRDEFGHLPPGDVRRCLLALSADGSETIMRRLFEYRFDRGAGLGGHSFGNLMLAALTELTGNTDQAITEAARLLNVKGEVIPVTFSDSRLCARLKDGTIIYGETNIDIRRDNADCAIERVFLAPPSIANPAALAAIDRADIIVIGPGDLYTSVIPNLLVQGVPQAIARSRATKIYVCNLMTKHGETDRFTASRFTAEVQEYLGSPGALDHVIVNDPSMFPKRLIHGYAREQSFPVEPDLEACARLGVQVHFHPLAATGTLLRHDPNRLARAIMRIAGHLAVSEFEEDETASDHEVEAQLGR